MKTRPGLILLFCVASAFLLIISPAAQAGCIVTLEQVGPDVVATGSGAIDLTGLSFDFVTQQQAHSLVFPVFGEILTGSPAFVDAYRGISEPTSFGSGSDFTLANTGTGDLVGVSAFLGLLIVPHSYVSNAPLSDSATYDNATFSSLGVTPGTYVWAWGTGVNQNFTLQIPRVTVPDSDSTVCLLLLGLAALLCASRPRVA
jgi:hypothetical protein